MMTDRPRPPMPSTEDSIMSKWLGEGVMVSVLVHSYNHHAFIDDAICGILSQSTDFPFEVVICDDASTDGTRKIIERYVSEYPRIVRAVFQEVNQYSRGMVNPIMISQPQARGKYIAICDGDDYWVDREKLSRQIRFLEENPDFVVCYTDMIPLFNGRVIKRDFGGSKRDLTQHELQRSPAICTSTSCYRNVVELPPEFVLAKYADKALWSMLGAHGKGHFLGEISPSVYRVHEGGVHSMADPSRRFVMAIQTYASLAAYHGRTSNHELERFFLGKVLVASIFISPVIRWLPVLIQKTKAFLYHR